MTTSRTIIVSGTHRQEREPRRSTHLPFLIPILVFVALAVAYASGLTLDPKALPSPLIGKPMPPFDLRAVKGRIFGLSSTDLMGEVALVNVFASWCTACRAEHPLLMQFKATGIVAIYGLNYKDLPDNAAKWLDTLGDPYARTGADRDGRVAIDWGVYGVPETFVITKNGRIVHRHIGPLTENDFDKTILPMVERLRKQ